MGEQVETKAEPTAAESTAAHSSPSGVLWRELRYHAKSAAATDLRTIAESGTPTRCEVLGVALTRFAASGGLQAHHWVAFLSLPVTTCLIGLGTALAWAIPAVLASSAVVTSILLTLRCPDGWCLKRRRGDWTHTLARLRPTASPIVAATWWRRRRPTATEVLDALGHLDAGRPVAAEARHALADMERRRASGSLTADDALDATGAGPLHKSIAARILFGRLGREAAEAVERAAVGGRERSSVRSLARLLAQESRLLRRALTTDAVCMRCVCRPKWGARRGVARVPRLTWFGCPRCGSAEWLREWKGEIVCVLDGERHSTVTEEGDSVRVNWLERARRRGFEGEELVEFDRVEIRRATDAEVAHFLVDITSDTDRGRRKRHSRAVCTVSRDCALSANTLAALRGTFRDVAVE